MRVRVAAATTAVVAAAALGACADDGPYVGRSPTAGLRGESGGCPPITGYVFPVAEHGSADFAGAAVIEIDAGDSFFAPTCALNVPAGAVTLRVTNTGTMKHNVTITEQGIDVDVLPGETIDVDVDVTAGAAPLVFVCKYHRTAGMVGALVAGR
jgi:plastocyanin